MFSRSLISHLARLVLVALAVPLGACGGGLPAVVRAEMARTPRGTVTVVEFVDFECPFCRRLHAAAAPALKANAPQVRIVRKQVPLSIHAHAESAARVYLCAEELGARTDELADTFFSAPPDELAEGPAIATAVKLGAPEDKMTECVHDAHITTRLREDGRAFSDAGGEGVPLTYVGANRLDGAVDEETFAAALRDALEKAK